MPLSALLPALALLCALSMTANAVSRPAVPPDPVDDPLLVTAGFLDHHQDLKYRLLGMEAYRSRDFDRALRFFRRASFFADKPSQGMVAEMYWNGDGLPRDPVLAYVWMDLAAERGYAGFLGLRERYWNALDSDERKRAIEEGQAVYARFGDAAAQPRYEHQLRIGRRLMTGSRVGFNRSVQIEIPGPGGSQFIEGSKYYDDRYWDARKYWAWQDGLWMKPLIGRVDVGQVQKVEGERAGSRIPATSPEMEAPVPEVPEPPLPSP